MTKNSLNTKNSRPLSPHLSIYKFQISSVLSVGHRMSGAGLFFVLLAFCWWFIFWVFSKFEPCYLECVDNGYVKFILLIACYGYFYHFCTGIRHLIWDAGVGFSVKSINRGGLIAVLFSLFLTVFYRLII